MGKKQQIYLNVECNGVGEITVADVEEYVSEDDYQRIKAQWGVDCYNVAAKAFIAGYVNKVGKDFNQITKYNNQQEMYNDIAHPAEMGSGPWESLQNCGAIPTTPSYSAHQPVGYKTFYTYIYNDFLWFVVPEAYNYYDTTQSSNFPLGMGSNDAINMLDKTYAEGTEGNAQKVGDSDTTCYVAQFKFSVDNIGLTPTTYDMLNTDYALKPIVSKWYQALRTIALVGLLSVLVYIGIRIILSSSSAQDKAKYKNMLKEWLVAVCILFILHYVMAFMLQFGKELTNILVGNSIEKTLEGNKSDKLMNTVRSQIGDMDNLSGWETAGYTLMWLVLVILTGTFTFQYLKRVIYMAFLTMIAPMIALTYPLDKIKDGKAQAFSFWLKEYIFQCLIQPVHLLLYSMLIGSAIDFATTNMLYSLVALGFLVPAEKLIKQMFGMKSETSSGNFSAAMGGAAVMSMMNKLKGVGPKNKKEEEQQSSGGKSGVRTSSNRSGGTSSGGSGGASGSAPLEQGQSEGGAPSGGTPSPVVGDGAATPVGNSTATTTQWEEFDRANERSRQARENATNQNSSSGPSRLNKFGRGLRGTGHIIGRAIGGPKGIKYRGRKLTGKALGLLGGAAGATIGLAAAIASGDESKILPNMAGGFIAGDAVGERMSEEGYKLKDKVTNGASDYANVFKEGYMSRDLETFKSEMIGQEYAGIRITEENVEEIFNRIQELRNSGTEI